MPAAFEQPFKMERRDCKEGYQRGERLDHDITWDRVNGRSRYSWELVRDIIEFYDMFYKTTILLTRFGLEPPPYILERPAIVDTIVHVSASTRNPSLHRERVLCNLERYKDVGGRAVRRVVTAWCKDEESELCEIQNDLMSMDSAFQQPLRIRRSSPLSGYLDLWRYEPTISNTDCRVSYRWWSASDIG